MTVREHLKFQELCRKQWIMKKRLTETSAIPLEGPRMMVMFSPPTEEIPQEPPPQKH